jgi:hypothetical protein
MLTFSKKVIWKRICLDEGVWITGKLGYPLMRSRWYAPVDAISDAAKE